MTEIPEIITIDIPEKNLSLYLPTSLKVLDREQYISFFELFHLLDSKKMDVGEFAIGCVYKFLNLKKGKRKAPEEEIEDALSTIALLAEYIINFFHFEENRLSLKLEYTKNHIDEIKISRFKKVTGPADYFENTSFGQYEDALNIFLQYNEIPSRELLQHLCATLYLPKNETYCVNKAKKNIKKFSSTSIGILYGVYYTFAAFHTYFSGSRVYYNGKMIDLSILFKETPADKKIKYTSPLPSLGLRSTSIEIAKSGILGNLNEVRAQKLWDVALILYDMRKKSLDDQAIAEINQKKN